MNDAGAHNIWRSYSDMMSGLLLLFVLIMAVCLMQAQKNYNDKLAEQASRIETQDELEQAQSALSTKESELDTLPDAHGRPAHQSHHDPCNDPYPSD